MLFYSVWGFFWGGVFNNLWSNQLHGKAFPLKESRGLGSMRSLRGRSKNTQQQKHNWRSLEPRKIPRGIQDIRGSGIRAGTGTQDLSPCQSQQVTSAALLLLNREINKQEEGQGVGKGSTAGCSCCSRARGSSSERAPKWAEISSGGSMARSKAGKLLGGIWTCTYPKIQGNRRFHDRRLFPCSTSKGRAGWF